MLLFLIKKIFNLTIKLRKLPWQLDYKFNNFVKYLEYNSGYRYQDGKPKQGKVKEILYDSANDWVLPSHFSKRRWNRNTDTRDWQLIKSGTLNVRRGIINHYSIVVLDRLLFFLVGQLSIAKFCDLVDNNEIITNAIKVYKP